MYQQFYQSRVMQKTNSLMRLRYSWLDASKVPTLIQIGKTPLIGLQRGRNDNAKI
jgi:hypothetical protein